MTQLNNVNILLSLFQMCLSLWSTSSHIIHILITSDTFHSIDSNFSVCIQSLSLSIPLSLNLRDAHHLEVCMRGREDYRVWQHAIAPCYAQDDNQGYCEDFITIRNPCVFHEKCATLHGQPTHTSSIVVLVIFQ